MLIFICFMILIDIECFRMCNALNIRFLLIIDIDIKTKIIEI